MSRLVSKAEGWEVAYTAFQNINFAAYDYNTIKQSMIEYIQLYFAESFNDYIESSEFIALLELFAYLGEIMAYRLDINASENSIDLAQRKQSVLRLAKLVSYKASRNVPARGLVKLQTISTTERIYDLKGKDLSNVIVNWNDSNNIDWKEQFFTVMDRVLQQDFGTVSPNERVQVNDVLFELYPVKNEPLTNGVIGYNITANSSVYNMELVPTTLSETGPLEARPSRNSRFTLLYGADGLGDSSNLTGFFAYTKQGSLNRKTEEFDGILPNQTYTIGAQNINNTDVWINNINPDTGDTIDTGEYSFRASGEWQEVDLANAQNIIFNTNPVRTKYEIETLENDDVRIIFGDGEFSDIPAGTFDIWYRTSSSQELFIPDTSVTDKRGAFKYVDGTGRIQTLTFTFKLINSLQNNAPSEDIDHIRRMAPSVYYAQDRMVNGRDYNTFPLQDSSILKLRTINRTFAGDTAYQSANDASLTYQDVKIFGNDLCLFYTPTVHSISAPGSITNSVLLTNYVEPLLSTIDVYINHIFSYDPDTYRREFTSAERSQIASTFSDVNYPWPVYLIYFDKSSVGGSIIGPDGNPYLDQWIAFAGTTNLGSFVPNIVIDLSVDLTTYTITYRGMRMVADSPTTRFYYDNSGQRVLSFDTLNSNNDLITIIQANKSSTPNMLLQENIPLQILQIERYQQGLTDAGLPNYNRVAVSTVDLNGDNIPENILIPNLMNTIYPAVIPNSVSYTSPLTINTIPYVVGQSDVVVDTDGIVVFSEGGLLISAINSSSDRTPLPSEEYNTFFVLGNYAASVGTGDIINIQTSDTIKNGLYRVNTVTLVGSYTKITIVTNLSLADPLNEYPGIKIAIPGAGVQGSTAGGIMSVYGRVSTSVVFLDSVSNVNVTITVKEYVYLSRLSVDQQYQIIPTTIENMTLWANDSDDSYIRYAGKSQLNFLWQHRSSQMNLIDPSTTNIHDMFVISRSYYTQLSRWLADDINSAPALPTSSELRNSYSKLLDNKMLSDTVILHPGKVKILLGTKAQPELRAKIKVIRTENKSLTDNQVKIRIVNIVRDFFKIDQWEFGETFYYTELDTVIQSSMPSLIASTVLVPVTPSHVFGDLYQVYASEDEILQVHITVDDVEVVDSYSATNLRQYS